MGLIETLGRIPKIMEANINAILDKCEDPAKMIDQLLVDYRRNLASVKKDTAAVIASEKIAKKELDECDAEIERVAKAAKNALLAGNQEDAGKLVERKQKLESTRSSLADNYAVCQQNVVKMRDAYNKLVDMITDLETRKDAAKAKLSIAKAQKGINAAVAKANSTVESERFSKYEEMAERALAEAEASAELDTEGSTTEDLMDKYSTPGNSASVDAELARMKAELGIQ